MWPERLLRLGAQALGTGSDGPHQSLLSNLPNLTQQADVEQLLVILAQALSSSSSSAGSCQSPHGERALRHPASSGAGAFLAGFLCCVCLLSIFWYRLRAAAGAASKRRQQRQVADAISKMAPQEMRDVLGEVGMPAWVNLPDFQRVQWFNQVLAQVWPFFARMVTSWAQDNVTNMLEASKPPWIRSVRMRHVSLGTVTPEATSVKVYRESRANEILMDVDLMWAGDQDMTFVVKPVPRAVPDLPLAGPLLDLLSNAVVLKAAIERWTVNACMRVRLGPLQDEAPIVGGVQVSLTEVPRFAFDLTFMGGELAVLPGLESWLHGLIQDTVFRPYVLPDKYTISFVEGAREGFDQPRGLLDVRVLEARHVPRLDIITASDPYVKLFVRSKQQLTTQVKENTSRPHWDERFQFLVHYPPHQALTAVMYDYDSFDADDEVGRVSIPIRDLRGGQEVDDWFEVLPAHQEKPSSDKYFKEGNPVSWAAGAGQKVTGLLTRPWEHRPFSLLRRDDKSKAACQLHLQLRYTELDPADVDPAARAERQGPGSEAAEKLRRLAPHVQNILRGGVLYVRVQRVESLTGKAWVFGGWTRSIKIKAELVGVTKWTAAAKGKKDPHPIDQELEFIVDGEHTCKEGRLELEVWDMHWRNDFKGRLSIPFRHIRDSQMLRHTYDLADTIKGRISLELQWVPAFAAT